MIGTRGPKRTKTISVFKGTKYGKNIKKKTDT